MDSGICNSYLLVNKNKFQQNILHLLQQLHPNTQLIPVLKANAYGLGLVPIGRILASYPQIQTLAVAQISEGLALRQAEIEKEILILGNVPPHLLPLGVKARLTFTLGRLGLLPQLALLAQQLNQTISIQIKLETGLHRIGIAPGEELAQFCQEWKTWGHLFSITGAFTHFANLSNTSRTHSQWTAFLQGLDQLKAAGISVPLRHAGASACSEYFPQYQLDALRIGRRLYMDHPTAPLGVIQEVSSWRTWITGLRHLQAGQPLGYGDHKYMERTGTVALLGIGYGDGLSQALVEAGGPVLIQGKRGRLLACCMDQTLVDVTDIPCSIGDEVTLWGEDGLGNQLPIQQVALLIGQDEGCGLTTQLSARVARVYLPSETFGNLSLPSPSNIP